MEEKGLPEANINLLIDALTMPDSYTNPLLAPKEV